jgi:hypothetical protein
MSQKKRKHIRHYIDKKLLFRLRMFIVIFVALLGFVIYELISSAVNPVFALLGIVLGIGLGTVLARMYKLSWNKDETKVVGRLDMIGIIILIVYIGFALSRNFLFGHIIQGPSLGVFTLSITAGSMLGRVLATHQGIRDLLKASNIHL